MMSPDTNIQAPSANGIGSIPAPGSRSSDQIRADIVARREHLARDVDSLRGRVNEITDWRAQARKHQTEIAVGAAVVGALAGAALYFRFRRR